MLDENYQLNFSQKRIGKLKNAINALQQSLSTLENPYYKDYLKKVLSTAQQKDTQNFQSLVLSNDLFGGSGALWEIFFDDPIQNKKFKHQFVEFIDSLAELGISDARIQQVKDGLILKDK